MVEFSRGQTNMGVSLNGGTPISHPKMIIFSRKTIGLLGKPTILGNPQKEISQETKNKKPPSKSQQSSKISCTNIGLTLQGINISQLGKRKIIVKMPFLGDMLVPWRVSFYTETMNNHQIEISPRRSRTRVFRSQHSTLL